MSDRFEERVAITGVGRSAVGRRLGRSGLDLTVDAVLAALADAGLDPSEVDGIATFPGESADPGFAGTGVWELRDALDLDLRWFVGAPQTSGQLGVVVDACMAVACGLARHVVCFRTVAESSAQGSGGRAVVTSRLEVADWRRWFAPFGAPSAAGWLALYAQRHFHQHGTTREQLAQVALTCRANAARNPDAVYREPMALDDYLAARMISTPFCLYDCDVPVDGSTAIVVSDVATAGDRPNPAVHLAAVGTGLGGAFAWDQHRDLTEMAATDAARAMWSRTDLRPADVDVAELYDGFSFLTLAWLEALGFCGRGEGGAFLEGGHRIALDGELPINTQGGQLSAGRLHGFGHLHEAVLQLRHAAGDRQVAGCEVAIAAAGGGPLAGCLLLTR